MPSSSWAAENDVRLDRSYAYSDSYFDAPLLALVGNPVAVNPDARLAATAAIKGWPIRHLDKSDGVIKIGGREIQEWTRPLMRPELVAPYADISFHDVDKIPAEGPAIVVFNHRSYFDPTVMGLLFAKAGRNLRGLGKKEVFDVPIIGRLDAGDGWRARRAIVRAPTNRCRRRPDALEGGEVVMMAPEGHDSAGTGVLRPGTEGPMGRRQAGRPDRGSRDPGRTVGHRERLAAQRTAAQHEPDRIDPPSPRPVGDPIELGLDDPDADTKAIMAALVDLLPPEARERRTPTERRADADVPARLPGRPERRVRTPPRHRHLIRPPDPTPICTLRRH